MLSFFHKDQLLEATYAKVPDYFNTTGSAANKDKRITALYKYTVIGLV
jgi:hypothetical protein